MTPRIVTGGDPEGQDVDVKAPCYWCRGRGVYACENIETGYRNRRACPRCNGSGVEPRCTCGVPDTPNELPPLDPYCPVHGKDA